MGGLSNNRSINSFTDFYDRKSGVRTLVLLFALCCLPGSVFALGFGVPVIESYLHEPLKGYVPLLLSETEHIERIKVELATPAEYRRLGLQWHDHMALIRVLLPRTVSGEIKITLSSVGAVTSPMLSIVLKASATGRSTYFRHFRILLDPPYMSLSAGNKPQVSSVLPAAKAQVSGAEKNDAGWARVWRYGPVRSGDNLSEIAYRLRRDKRWSNRQVMLSLYEENMDSFIARDIHRLKSGAWLSVPSAQIVRKNGSKSALEKLHRLIKARPEVSEKKPAVIAEGNKKPSGELRYSGLIAVKKAVGSKQAKKAADSSTGKLLENLESIHSEVMSSKLQMDQLGKTVEGLGKSMTGLKVEMKLLRQEVLASRQAPAALKQEVIGLRKEVADIKQLLAASVRTSDMLPLSGAMLKNYWALAFFVLLIACLGFLIGSVYQRCKRRGWEAPEAAGIEHGLPDAGSSAQAETPEAVTDRMLNNIEASLSRCEYEQAEQSLMELEQLVPDSLQASVLRAQLYHETDRIEQRDRLISAIGEESDEDRWERFCHQLPSHVWNACFGDGGVRPESPQADDSTAMQK